MRKMTSALVATLIAATPAAALARPDVPQAEDQQQQQPSQTYQTNDQNNENSQNNDQTTQEDTFQYEASSGPRLGIMVTGLTPELRSHYGAPSDRGVLVSRVAPNSPAARAGLRVGDVLVAVRGQSISASDDVIDVLSSLNRGETFSLTVVRDQKMVTLQARLGQPHNHGNGMMENKSC